MEKIFITIIILYAILVSVYFLRMKAKKRRKKDIVGKGSTISEIELYRADIVGKSKFEMSQVIPSATISPEIEKGIESPGTSSNGGNEQSDVDYLDDEYTEEEDDAEESEEVEGAAQAMLASGVSFDELKKAINIVDRYEHTSPEEKKEAGKILIEVHQTDMLEQIVSGKPNRAETVSTILASALSAYYKKLDDNNPDDSNKKREAVDFDINDFV